MKPKLFCEKARTGLSLQVGSVMDDLRNKFDCNIERERKKEKVIIL